VSGLPLKDAVSVVPCSNPLPLPPPLPPPPPLTPPRPTRSSEAVCVECPAGRTSYPGAIGFPQQCKCPRGTIPPQPDRGQPCADGAEVAAKHKALCEAADGALARLETAAEKLTDAQAELAAAQAAAAAAEEAAAALVAAHVAQAEGLAAEVTAAAEARVALNDAAPTADAENGAADEGLAAAHAAALAAADGALTAAQEAQAQQQVHIALLPIRISAVDSCSHLCC